MNTKQLNIGWASADITPKEPAVLYGQYYERLSQYVESPLLATACAIEATGEDGSSESAIMVSIDSLHAPAPLLRAVREQVAILLPGVDVSRVLLFATHTHSAPAPDTATAYGHLLIKEICGVIVKAWNSRAAGAVSYSLEYEAIAFNRRVEFSNGRTEMYGDTLRPDFTGIEGPADSSVDIIWCRNSEQTLSGIIMNVPCPAQVTEAKYYVSADYWGAVRTQIKQKFGEHIFILPLCGVSGDLSPRDLSRPYSADQPNMWDIAGAQHIGKRLAAAAARAYAAAPSGDTRPCFHHVVRELSIPLRTVSEEEYLNACTIVEEIHSREPLDPADPDTAWNRFLAETKANEQRKQHGPWDNKDTDYGIVRKQEIVLAQYEAQKVEPPYKAEVHVIRLGDMVIATNPFELFVDFGFIIRARSKAKHTIVSQLCCDYGDYLPTEKALKGGGYSAIATPIGPDGGYALAEGTLEIIDQLYS